MDNITAVWQVAWPALFSGFAGGQISGEFLWMNGATWAQLLSGIIGSVLGAVAAVWVAMHVLRQTLREQATIASNNEGLQRELAAEAARAQVRLANEQLQQQRAALETQLLEQRAALNLQLKEQRREASLNREQAAIAELIVFLSGAMETALLGAEIKKSDFGPFIGVLARWQLETTDDVLRDELFTWLPTWKDLLSIASDPELFGLKTKEAMSLYTEGTALMLSFARDWTTATEKRRAWLLKKSNELKGKLPKRTSE